MKHEKRVRQKGSHLSVNKPSEKTPTPGQAAGSENPPPTMEEFAKGIETALSVIDDWVADGASDTECVYLYAIRQYLSPLVDSAEAQPSPAPARIAPGPPAEPQETAKKSVSAYDVDRAINKMVALLDLTLERLLPHVEKNNVDPNWGSRFVDGLVCQHVDVTRELYSAWNGFREECWEAKRQLEKGGAR